MQVKILSTLEPELQSEESTKATSIADEIQKLKKLLDDGILTEEEFNQQKSKLLK
jgi:predicted Zn-dependent peptidase